MKWVRRGCWLAAWGIIVVFAVSLTHALIMSFQGDGSRRHHFQEGGYFSGSGPSLSPDGRLVVFASPKTGNGDLYKLELSTGEVARLTTSDDYECDASFSPDGAMIAFIREINEQGDVWIMKADGSYARALTSNKDDEGGPIFVTDRLLAFWKVDPRLRSRFGIGRAREIVLLDLKSGEESRLTNNDVSDVFPASSYDGKTIIFTREDSKAESETWVFDRLTNKETNLGSGSQGSLSKDGLRVVVVAGKFGRQIDVMDRDGKNRKTVYDARVQLSHPIFLPDGSAVIFQEAQGRGIGPLVMVKLSDLSVRIVGDTR